MDITDSIQWKVIAGKEPDNGKSCTFSLHMKDDAEQPMYISICSVFRKTTSQVGIRVQFDAYS